MSRCDLCDPSYGCFDGSAPCSKVVIDIDQEPPPGFQEEKEKKPSVWTHAKHPRFGYIYLLDEDEHVIAEFTEIDNEEKARIASCAPEAIRLLVDVRETWEIGSEARNQIDALLKKAGITSLRRAFTREE